jgi:DNA polymerase III alpha subunit
MAFINVSDEYDTLDIVTFPSQYKDLTSINKGDIVLISGKVERRMSRYQLVLEKINKL